MHVQCKSNCPLVSSSVCPHIHAKFIYQCFKIEGEEKDERYWRTRRKWGKIHFTSFMELKKYKENFQLLTSNDEYMKNWGYLLFSWLPQEWRPDIEIGYLKLLRFAQMLQQAHHRIIHRIRKLKICMNLNLTRSNTFMILFKLISFPLIKKPWIFAKGMNRNGFWKLEHEWHTGTAYSWKLVLTPKLWKLSFSCIKNLPFNETLTPCMKASKA